mmetsp:Transcript_10515/g.25495  ORF Transcript_10515/g.25495 Transcript_10515/m.25495 type:complete len:109 (+) Transcript_10515:1011-1337(+)
MTPPLSTFQLLAEHGVSADEWGGPRQNDNEDSDATHWLVAMHTHVHTHMYLLLACRVLQSDSFAVYLSACARAAHESALHLSLKHPSHKADAQTKDDTRRATSAKTEG